MNEHSEEHHQIFTQLRKYRIGGWSAEQGLKQDFRCAYCDLDLLACFNNYNSWVKEHIIPLSRGGEDTLENCVISCRPCNFLKRTYMPVGNSREEFIIDVRRHLVKRRTQCEEEVIAIRNLVRSTN